MIQRFDDVHTRPSRAQQVYLILIGLAAERKTITYKLLAKVVGFKGAGVFAQILGHIMFWCEENELPALTAVVVGVKGKPGSGLITAEDREAAREDVYRENWFRIVPPTPKQLAAAYKRGIASLKGR
jgi:hypothetical protein